MASPHEEDWNRPRPRSGLSASRNDAFTVGFPDEGGPDNTTFRHSWNYRPLPGAVRTAMRASHFLRALGTGWLLRSGYQIGDMTPAMQYPIPPDDEVLKNLEGATGKYFRRNLETLIVLIRQAGGVSRRSYGTGAGARGFRMNNPSARLDTITVPLSKYG